MAVPKLWGGEDALDALDLESCLCLQFHFPIFQDHGLVMVFVVGTSTLKVAL